MRKMYIYKIHNDKIIHIERDPPRRRTRGSRRCAAGCPIIIVVITIMITIMIIIPVYIYIYIHTYVYTHTYIYIYIYIYREREIHIHTHTLRITITSMTLIRELRCRGLSLFIHKRFAT